MTSIVLTTTLMSMVLAMAAASPREITYLPGLQDSMKSRHFSGYIDVSTNGSDRSLFSWVVHSERSLEDDPVILWLTGGPGCSSMDAFIYEHGPFAFHLDDDESITLTENPYSWSKLATMIYVDSPAGAGLSYSESKADYQTNDTATIDDLARFLITLMGEMPELSKQDLYLAGESYGGVYVPKLAQKILDLNKFKGTNFNLKGYLVGNPVTDDVIEGNSQVDYAFHMGLMDPPTHRLLYEAPCRGIFWNATPGTDCKNQLREAFHTFYWVNPYDILEPCASSGNKKEVEAAVDSSRRLTAPMTTSRPPLMHWRPYSSMLKHTVPCADRRAALLWLSKDDVRHAIHARSVDKVPWQPCSDILNYTIIDLPIDVVPIHQSIHQSGLRALIYSGDHDFIIPFSGTRDWVYQRMGLEIVDPYSSWMINGQVAGFRTKFKGGFTFATIKGAGHMSPQTNPFESLELLARFLNDEL